MLSDTLCAVTNFSLHGVTSETIDVALCIIIMCQATTNPRRPRPLDREFVTSLIVTEAQWVLAYATESKGKPARLSFSTL